MQIRIQKYLSEQGVLSRREAEAFIKKGLIAVNGKKVTIPSFNVKSQYCLYELEVLDKFCVFENVSDSVCQKLSFLSKIKL